VNLISFWIFLFFSLGISLAKYIITSFWIFFILAIISLGLSWIFFKKQNLTLSNIFLLILIVLVGGLAFKNRSDFSSYNSCFDFKKEIYLKIKVVSYPKQNKNFKVYKALVESVKEGQTKKPIDDYVFVRDYSGFDIKYHGVYWARGRLRTKGNYKNLWLKKTAFIKKDRDPGAIFLAAEFVSLKIKNAFDKFLSKKASSLLSALFLGRRSGLDKETRDDFKKAGLSHILAVSGLHVGIVYCIGIVILKMLGFRKFFDKIFIIFLISQKIVKTYQLSFYTSAD